MIRLAMKAGPPVLSAITHIAMKVPEVPMKSMCPEPKRLRRIVCRMVIAPLITKAVKTAQFR